MLPRQSEKYYQQPLVAVALSALAVWLAVFIAWPSAARAGIPVFGPPILLTAPGEPEATDTAPTVSTDGAGIWIAAWASDNSLSNTIGNDFDILVARSTDGGATWTPPAALNTNAAVDSGWDDGVELATDGAGTWIAAWDSDDPLGGTIGTDRDLLFARSTDNGVTWTPPAALNTNAAVDSASDYQPQLATDRAGTWIAVWGSTNDIFFARSTDNGVTWTAPAHASSDSSSESWPYVAANGAGSWLAVWNSETLV
jgi:Neuraminidase (sialidase)